MPILVEVQRTCSNAARENGDLEPMINLATQSQLMREAAEAFTPGLSTRALKEIGKPRCLYNHATAVVMRSRSSMDNADIVIRRLTHLRRTRFSIPGCS